MYLPYFFAIFLPFLTCQLAMKHLQINFDVIFKSFAHLQHTQNAQQMMAEAAASFSTRANANAAFERLNQNSENAKMCYRATISPPGRYAIIAWEGVNEADKECQQKIIMPTKAKEKLFFSTDAFDEIAQLAKCFRHFYIARSDANGQFELRHNLLAENDQNGTNNNIWCSLLSSVDFVSKFWLRGAANGQKSGDEEDDPFRNVQLQILPTNSKGKSLPSAYNVNLAAQIMRKYKAEDLCNGNGIYGDEQQQQQQVQPNLESIEYHPTDERTKIVTDILNRWKNSAEFVAENAFFLVAYLRFLVFEMEKIAMNRNSLSNRDTLVAIMAKYDKIAVFMLQYGTALMLAFQKAQQITLVGILDANFLREMLEMTNRMCSLLSSTPQVGTMFKSWTNFCGQFDLAYDKFSKKRNKFMFTLLDRCLFGGKPCYIEQHAIGYVEHLVFQAEWIASDKWSTIAQMNKNDQNFLAQIGQILSVAKANKNEKSELKVSFLEEKMLVLGPLNALFGRICKNWQNFGAKFAGNEMRKFNAWTKLCKTNAFERVYRQWFSMN